MNAPFGRLLTAMVTPFTADGALDLNAAAELATYLVDAGNDGLVISGTTGESPTTSDEEQDTLLRAVIEAVGDRAHIVAGVGTNNTAHTIELARHAEKAGAAGVLVVTPYYSKPPQAGLANHFRMIADATELPVILYDIPGRSVVPIETETLIALAEHPRIVAVKDAKGDPFATTRVLAATDLAFYSGDDANALPWFAMGAAGLIGVASHVCSKQYVEMIAAVDAGDLPTARRLSAAVAPAVQGIMTITQGAIAAKAALQLLGLLEQRTTRPPLIDATDEEIETLRTHLKAAGLPV
jgi:4-hydroxy-tetrahydrodipicolinate synthase